MTSRPPMRLEFNPRTIEHLGPKLYSRLPAAVAELVANAYDANARAVQVIIETDPAPLIRVLDDGHGMTPAEVQDAYLQIGRDRRSGGDSQSRRHERKVSGKKGLGKLALFGIGHHIELKTEGEDEPVITRVTLDWDAIMAETGTVHEPPTTITSGDGTTGTVVTISELQRTSPVDPKDLADSLSRLFAYGDDQFQVTVVGPDDVMYRVDAARRKAAFSLARTWNFPDDFPEDHASFLRARGVSGWIAVSNTVVPTSRRGVAVYSKGRRVCAPGFFGEIASNIAYSYMVGEVTADFLDDLEPDVISTARTEIDWDTAETQATRTDLGQAVRYVANERRKLRQAESGSTIEDAVGMKRSEWIESINGPQRARLETVLDEFTNPDNEILQESGTRFVKAIFSLAPEHAEWVWRSFHEALQTPEIKQRYESGSYHSALQEAVALFIELLRAKAGLPADKAELETISAALGLDRALMAIGDSHPGATRVSKQTRKNIDEALPELGRGLWRGFRSPLDHHTEKLLVESGVLTYQDCLDALSLMSHLLHRIDEAEVRVP